MQRPNVKFSIGKLNRCEYQTCCDLQGKHTWCCNAPLIQAFQTKSPRFPKASSLALGKLSVVGDLRGMYRQGDPKPAPHPSTASAAPRVSTDAPVKPTDGHGHELILKCHCSFHLQKYSQPKGTSPSNVPRGQSWNSGCQGCKHCPLCRCHPAMAMLCLRLAPFPQHRSTRGTAEGLHPSLQGPNPNATPANFTFTAHNQEATAGECNSYTPHSSLALLPLTLAVCVQAQHSVITSVCYTQLHLSSLR